MLKNIETKTRNVILIIISLILLTFCLLSNDKAKWLEIYGVSFGLVQAALIMFDKNENWIFFNSYIIAFLILSFIFNLYGDVLENSVYIILGIVGTMKWYKTKTDEFKIEYMNFEGRLFSIITVAILTIILTIILRKTNDPLPFLDGITTAIGFVATYLMATKKVEAWIWWFIADILMIAVYYLIPQQPIYLLGLNVIWTIFAIGSLYNWQKIATKNNKKQIETI